MSTNPMLRRPSLAGAAALLVGALAAGPVLGQQAMLEVRIAAADGDVNPVTDSAFKLAETLGLYEKHGVKVTIVGLEGTPQAVAALNSGAVDLADISIDSVLRLKAENDVPIRGVVSSTLGPPFLVAGRCELSGVEDLAGRTYAINRNGSLDHNLTQHVLTANGVAADAPEFVPIGPPVVRAQALAAGQVDATTISFGSFMPIADTPGLCVLVSPENFFKAAPVQSKFIAGLESTIEEKREAIQRFSNAVIEASRLFASQPEIWVDVMVEAREDLSREDLTATTSYLAGRWCVNGCLNVGYIQETVDFIYASDDFKDVPVVTADDVTDELFVIKAIEALGRYQGGGVDARV